MRIVRWIIFVPAFLAIIAVLHSIIELFIGSIPKGGGFVMNMLVVFPFVAYVPCLLWLLKFSPEEKLGSKIMAWIFVGIYGINHLATIFGNPEPKSYVFYELEVLTLVFLFAYSIR